MAPSTSRVPPSQGDQQYSAPPFASTPSFALSTIDSSNIHYNINNPGFWGQTTPGHRQHHDHSQNLPDNYHRHQNFQNPVEDRRIQVNEAKRQLLPPAATGHHPTTVSQPWASSHVRNVSSGLSSHQNSGQSIYRTPYQPVVTPPNSQVSTSPPSTVPAPPESASMTLLSAPTIQNTQANNLRNTFRNEFRERVFQIGDQISKRLQNKNIIPRVLAFVQSFPKSGEPFDRLPSDEHFFKAIKGAESVIAARDTRIKILIKEVDDHKALAGRWGMKDPTSGKTRLQELAERTSYLERTLLQREAELAAKVKEATHLQQKCQHLIGLLEKRMPGTTSTAAILDTKLQNHGISPMSRTLDPISIDLTSDEASTPASAAISNNNSASLSRGSSSEGSISKVVEFHNQLKRKSLNWLEGGHPLKTRLNPYARPRKGRYSSTTIDLDAQPLDEDALMEGNGTSPSGEISLDTLNSNTERDEREKQKKLERARKNKESREKSKLKKRQEAEKRDAAKSAEVEAEAEAERVRKQQEEAENAAKAERFRKEQEDALRRKQQNKIIRDQRVAKEKHRRAEEEDQKQKERLERQRKNAFLAGQNQLEEPKPVVMEEADDDSMRDLFEDDDDSPELYHTDVDAPATETQEMAKAIFDPEAESNKQRQILEDEHLFGESTKTNDETVIQMDENVQRNAHADESENFGDGDDGSSDDDDGFDEDSTAEVPNTSQEDDDSDAEFDAEFDAEISKLLQAGSLAAEEIADQDVGQQATSGVAGDDSSEESEAE
ncbi:hypothetical protein MMC12_001755 [Toensbergia leucococca]|nr:hypothetical protein [Toensbergia leucococca]